MTYSLSRKTFWKRQDCTALTFLACMSAAFDNIDHQIPLDRLNEWIGLGGNVLKRVVNYSKHYFQSLHISSIHSNPIKLLFCVPQGSVLVQPLYIMYTTPLGPILSKANDVITSVQILLFPIDILGTNISPTSTSRNLGAILDSYFKVIPYFNSIIL